MLVVEPNPVFRELLCVILRTNAFTVSPAASLGEAQMWLTTEPGFTAIICEDELPDGSGLELQAWLSEKGVNTPLLLTSRKRFRLLSWFQGYPQPAFLSKPFTAAQLLSALDQVQHSRSAGPEVHPALAKAQPQNAISGANLQSAPM